MRGKCLSLPLEALRSAVSFIVKKSSFVQFGASFVLAVLCQKRDQRLGAWRVCSGGFPFPRVYVCMYILSLCVYIQMQGLRPDAATFFRVRMGVLDEDAFEHGQLHSCTAQMAAQIDWIHAWFQGLYVMREGTQEHE